MNIVRTIKKIFSEELPFFFAASSLVWQVIFFLCPLLFIISLSFVDSSYSFTLDNYNSLFDVTHIRIISYSLALACFTAFSCLIIAYPIAYFLATTRSLIRNILLFFLVIPFWSNLLILMYAWFFILDKDGLLNMLLLKLGLIKAPLLFLNSLPAIGVVMFYCYLPFMVLPILNSLERIDATFIEASYDLGANAFQTFWYVILPLSWHGIKTGFFLVFVIAFGEFVIPLLMGGDKYMFVGNAISHYILTAFDTARGAAFTCVSVVTLILVFGVIYYILKRIVRGK